MKMIRLKTIVTTCFLLTLSVLSFSYVMPAHAFEPHKNIKGLFNSTRDVTIKCLQCHKQQADEVLQSTHWTWKRKRTVNGKEIMFGKKDSLAGFAIDIASNPSRCLKCHISNSPAVGVFEKTEQAEIDCLVCHDTTGKYTRNHEKIKLEQDDFEFIARNVGRPLPGNCTSCHFAECGLPASSTSDSKATTLKYPVQEDIHMADRVGAFTCQTCHANGSGHSFSRTMSHPSDQVSREGKCSSCHTPSPHKLNRLNSHTEVIACQTCHIPEYATQTPATISWNWLLASKNEPVFQSVSSGRALFQDSNGFTASTMIQPVYKWDDGGDLLYSRGQRIKPQELTYLQRPSKRSPKSKITPFRIIYGTQLYDIKYRYLISPLLAPDGDALFPDSNWDTIAQDGMKAIVLPYSGQYGVVPTVTFRRINHGVVRTQEALGCIDCHGIKSRMDWNTLGYDLDPWSGDQGPPPAEEPLQENSFNHPTKPKPPVRESRIFADPGI